MSLIIENPETGETKTLTPDVDGRYPNFRLPWQVKTTLKTLERAKEINVTKEKLVAYAVDMGLPVSMFLAAGSWLLGCPYCQLGDQIVKLYEQGKITREQHKEMFLAVANAKSQDDRAALAKLKGQLEGLRTFR